MASLFGDYQPGAISSFLANVKAAGAGKQDRKKPSKQPKESSTPISATGSTTSSSATARLFDDAVRAKFVPQQPLPGLVAPPLKRGRGGEDGGYFSMM